MDAIAIVEQWMKASVEEAEEAKQHLAETLKRYNVSDGDIEALDALWTEFRSFYEQAAAFEALLARIKDEQN